MSTEKWPIGVFTSVGAGLGVDLAVAKEIGIPTVQIHAPRQGNRTSERAAEILQRLAEFDIKVSAVFGGFDGESYADIQKVAQTVGLVPTESRQKRLAEMKEISDFSKHLGCDVVALHLGFVPHQTESVLYREVVEVTQNLCRYVQKNGQSLHLETGQESALGLRQFIADVGEENLFVNFDPANMILYGTGEPIEALKLLGSRVRSCHFKDAVWSDDPGTTWGTEVPLGEGAVDIQRYMQTLVDIGYEGALTIEREIPEQPERQKTEIGQAVALIERCRTEALKS